MIMKSKYKYMYDAASDVALLAKDDPARVASFNGPEFALDTLQGYWTEGELADQTLAVVVNVPEDPNKTSETGTLTLNAVVTGNAVTISDGVASDTFTADTDFAVGGTDADTATNLTNAINASALNVSAEAAGNVVTVANLNESGASFSDASATITASAFSGADESYLFEVAVGPLGFASSEVVGRLDGIAKSGQYILLLDMDTVKQVKADTAAIRIEGTLGGQSPSITAYAWIASVQK